jgi:hypothetical protein
VNDQRPPDAALCFTAKSLHVGFVASPP